MKRRDAPELESRRAADFERELLTRAKAWIPSWSLDESEADFGLALLKIAARFHSEVAERLDQTGKKMALGFLDWLGIPAQAARPARVPMVFKMADTAREPILAPRPVKLQADVPDATVTFETEADLQVIPGQLAAVVAVDPEADSYYLPPPGLTSLDPLEPLPKAWKLKNFAAPGSNTLQLDPGIGLVKDMIVEIEGDQYRIEKAKDDLVTIDPKIPPGDGIAGGTRVEKVETFRPFHGARNLQEHILYIGDSELLNVEAEARIEVRGLGAIPDGVKWEYWGKSEPEDPLDAEPRWRELEVADNPPPNASSLLLKKPKGSIESTTVGTAEGRWIRARLVMSASIIERDGVTVRINPRQNTNASPPELSRKPIDWSKVLRPEVFVNSTPSPPSKFYPLGRQPRLLDTLYLGSEDAFSKKGATAWVQFDLSDAVFQSISAIDAAGIGLIVAAIDVRGALHLLIVGPGGTINRLKSREPMRPGDTDLLPEIAPVMWLADGNLYVAVASARKIHLWKEARPAAEQSGWEDHGSPRSGSSQDATIEGLVRVDWGGSTLVVTRGGAISKKSSSATNEPWVDHPTAFSVARIFPVSTQTSGIAATRLIALVSATSYELVDITVTGPTTLLDKIEPTVRPAAIEIDIGGAKTLQIIAADESRILLRAWDGNNKIESPKLRGTLKIAAGSQVAGHIEAGKFSAYAIALEDPPSKRQALLAWQPMGFKDILFEQRLELGSSEFRGAMAIAPVPGNQDIALLPGTNRGEIFGATLGGNRPSFTVPTSNLVSALAVAPSIVLAIGDTVAFVAANQQHQSNVYSDRTVGEKTYAAWHFYWLENYLDISTTDINVAVFRGDTPATAAGKVRRHSATEVEFDPVPTSAPDYIRVADAAGAPSEVIAISNMQGTGVATAEPHSVPGGQDFDYWLPTATTEGRFFPSVDLTGATGDSWTATALKYGHIYSSKLKPDRQPVVAIATNVIGQPLRLSFEQAWDATVPALAQPPVAGATVQFAVDGAVTAWASLFGEPDANPALSWEYWDGSGWTHLPVRAADDETNNLRNSGSIKFDIPDDLQATEWAGKTNYWVRARLIGGDYGEEKTVVTSQDKGEGKIEQTFDRIPGGVQPPYALDVGVAYAMDKVAIPTYLQTKDSGALRDQSDANRTPGAQVEVFTPLKLALNRFDAPALAANQTDSCLPDCECATGAPSMSPAPSPAAAPTASTPATASGAGRRALYLGFTSKLLGQPVNLLFNVEQENDYDSIGPLRVDALIGNRFAPIVSDDETRALGESGLLTMAFDVAPLQAELFGQALSWLRLAPRVGTDDWNPSIAGVYPNGVWAQSAETMTRELLGSSDGRPALTLTLARPPLLRDSLELRVREPLGDEEVHALKEDGSDLVKSAVTDLPGHWVLWKQVQDPTDCGPKDRVYSLDEMTGTVRFGDGLHGMIPPVGVDAIVAFAYRRTEAPIGEKVAANLVNPRAELNLVTPVESVETVFAADKSAGGTAPESKERVLQFAPAVLRHRDRAVSLRDFEELVRQKSEEVVQARAFRRNGRVRLVVVTKGATVLPSRAQQRAWRQALLEIAPPSLSVAKGLTIEGPRVRRLGISLTLLARNLDFGGRVAKEAKERLVARFEPAGGWSLGRTARDEDIAEALLDIPDLDGIVSIGLSEIDEIGTERPWPGRVARDELVTLASEDVRVGFDVMEAAA